MTSDEDWLLELLEREFPDPVDVFEDNVSAALGFRRGPGCSQAEWRWLRARFIDGATEDARDAEEEGSGR